MSYCIAFSVDGATDVTRRYVRKSEHALARTRCSEQELLYIMNEVKTIRREKLSKAEKFKLEGEDMRESKELRHFIISHLVSSFCQIDVNEAPGRGQATKSKERDLETTRVQESTENGTHTYSK